MLKSAIYDEDERRQKNEQYLTADQTLQKEKGLHLRGFIRTLRIINQLL